jgi:hypothetical protein
MHNNYKCDNPNNPLFMLSSICVDMVALSGHSHSKALQVALGTVGKHFHTSLCEHDVILSRPYFGQVWG